MAPASELSKAGIRPRGRMAFEVADGSPEEYDFGLSEFEFMGELTCGRVMFGPENCEPWLGVTVLESVGIMVDPATQQFRRLPALALKYFAGAAYYAEGEISSGQDLSSEERV